MFREVLTALLDRVPAMQPATAVGWIIGRLGDEPYPGITPASRSSHVDGFVLTDLTPSEWALVDAFENPFYALLPIELDSSPPAWAYVAPATVALAKHWDAGEFRRAHLGEYLTRCARWRERYEPRTTTA